MSDVLMVWIEGDQVARLWVDQSDWSFAYQQSWLESAKVYAISPHLPLTSCTHVDDGEKRTVRWFFDNLLPEGGVREALAAHARLDASNSFALLHRFGEESAGALTLLPEGQRFSSIGSYEPLTRDALRQLVLDLPHVPLLAAGGRAHMSLAGAQHKLGLHRNNEGFCLPNQAASSLVVKPDNAQPLLFPCCPANEYFCMTLAQMVGLSVPQSELLHLPEPLFCVQRYDRCVGGGKVTRLHQIDLCQLLNIWAGYKYEEDGGPSLRQAYGALNQTRQPAVSRNQWLRWLIFNYVIGNSDAHAKNISFLVSSAGISLAPAYDLLSVAVYGDDYDYMAMTIAEEVRYGWISEDQWAAMAAAFNISAGFIKRLRKELGHTIPSAARKLLGSPVFTEQERVFLEGVLRVIERHAEYLLCGC
ncbi:MAG: HipA domain-containing protein [Deltaproteobacteria bacterium]|nr:HipA domain-containing protein [Deltaproteobacteria bacterium]